MAKVTKSGIFKEEVSAPFFKNKGKIKRKKPLTPEEKNYIISHFENIQEVSSGNIYQTERKWSEKELEQQKQDLTNNSIIIGFDKPQKITKKQNIKRLISDLFCIHDNCIVKNGYRICPDCKSKWKVENKIGTTKSK